MPFNNILWWRYSACDFVYFKAIWNKLKEIQQSNVFILFGTVQKDFEFQNFQRRSEGYLQSQMALRGFALDRKRTGAWHRLQSSRFP